MTNNNIVVPTSNDGTGYSLVSVGGTFKMVYDNTDVTLNSTYQIVEGELVEGIYYKTQNGLTLQLNSTTGVYSTTGATWTSNAESFTLIGTFNNVDITYIFTVSKSKDGAQGDIGVDPQYVIVNGQQVFKYLENQIAPTEETIRLSAELFGGLTTYDWEYWDGDSWNDLLGTQNISYYDLSYDNVAWGLNNSIRIRCLSSDKYDEITIIKIYDGNTGPIGPGALNGYLTNGSVNVHADYNGENYSLLNTGGSFIVNQGLEDVTSQCTFSVLPLYGGASKNGLTLAINTSGVYSLSGNNWTTDQEIFAIQASYNDKNIVQLYSISKAKDGGPGSAGTDAQYVIVTGDQAFKYLSGSVLPTITSITLTANLFGGLTTYDWEYWNGTSWVNLSGTQNQQTYILAYNNSAWTDSKLRIRCLSSGKYDEITIVKLYDGIKGDTGQAAIDGYLTNENITVPTDFDGTNYSLSNAGGYFKIYEGLDNVNDLATFSGTTTKKWFNFNY